MQPYHTVPNKLTHLTYEATYLPTYYYLLAS